MQGGACNGEHDTVRDKPNVAFVAVILIIVGVCWAPSSNAQLNPFRGYRGPTLTKEDYDAASSAAQKLLQHEPAATGQAETWVGPQTGNQGTFTIRRVFQRSGMPCRAVASQVVYKQTQTKREFNLTACRIATGEWKLTD